MKYRNHLLATIASAKDSPAIQLMMAEFVGGVADFKPSKVIADAKAHGSKDIPSGADLSAAVADIYFSPPDIYYVKSDSRNEFEPRRERDVALKLAALGLSSKKIGGENLSEVQKALLKIQSEQSKHYAGPLTVHRVGPLDHGESSYLVTREPNFVVPVKGDPTPFLELTDHLCGVGVDPHGEEQKLILLGWFQQWFRAHIDPSTFIQGQILVIGGAPGIGKGRYCYFVGKLGGDRTYEPAKIVSNFNSELIGATTEMTHDGAFPDNAEDIREFWLKRKTLVANHEHRIEQKYHDGRTMPLSGLRGIVTHNLSDEAAKILPPMLLEPGMEDKIILLRGHAPPAPYPMQGTPEGKEWVEKVLKSLPAFVYYVKNEFVLPESMRDIRYGVATFHHPEIVALIKTSHPDRPLGEALDSWFKARANGFPGPWTGTATELFSELRLHNGAFSSVTKSPQHIGHQLKRLKMQPGWGERITVETVWIGATANQERRVSTILPPGDVT